MAREEEAASVASLPQLASKLLDAAKRIRSLYDTFKSAPETLEDIAFQLQTTSLSVRLLEQHKDHYPHDQSLFLLSMKQCHIHAARIEEGIGKLEQYMARSWISGTWCISFGESELTRLLRNITQAKESLQLVLMVFGTEMQTQRAHAHGSQLDQVQTQVQSGIEKMMLRLTQNSQSTFETRSEPQYRTAMTVSSSHGFVGRDESDERRDTTYGVGNGRDIARKKAQGRFRKTHFHATFALPTWLSTRIWDLAATQIGRTRSWNLQTYNVVPMSAEIISRCEVGDVRGVQKLIANGQASPLDVDIWGRTLLDVAASRGHLDVCRLLLHETVWPSHDLALGNALDSLTQCRSKDGAMLVSAGYQLFIEQAGLDINSIIDVESDACNMWLNGLVPWWFAACKRKTCLDVIVRNHPVSFLPRAAIERFEFAYRLPAEYFNTTAHFLTFIGVTATDPQLLQLRNKRGSSILHYISHQLDDYIDVRKGNDEHSAQAQEWIALVVAMLREGADPHTIAGDLNSTHRVTPLLEFLHPRGVFACDTALKRVRLWAKMMQDAGLNLMACGRRESQAWILVDACDMEYQSSSPTARCDGAMHLKQLIYAKHPVDWSVKVCRPPPHVFTHELNRPPGAFPQGCFIPEVIIWRPSSKEEEDEGRWLPTERKAGQGQPFDIRDWQGAAQRESLGEYFEDLVERSQDDIGVIMLMEGRVRRNRTSAPRSHSQPPPLQRRHSALRGTGGAWQGRDWMTSYHFCPYSSRYQFGCPGPSYAAMSLELTWSSDFDIRSCVEGRRSEHDCLQKTRCWYDGSFLAEIKECQDGDPMETRARAPELKHTGTPQCPIGCSKVILDKLNVPGPLQKYHPRSRLRYYGPPAP